MASRGYSECKSGLKISWNREPRAPLNSRAAHSDFCREPKDVLVSIHNMFKKLMKMQLFPLKTPCPVNVSLYVCTFAMFSALRKGLKSVSYHKGFILIITQQNL